MTNEEKQAIEMIKEQKENVEYSINAMECTPEDYDEDVYNDCVEWNKNAEIILNLIETQAKELDKKDNRIAFLEHINKELQNDFDNFKKDKDINYLDGIHHKQLVEKSIGQKIDKPEECWFDIFEVKVIKNNMLYGITTNEDFITLKEISDSDPDNCITVIAESPLSGAIYRYNNYNTKEWQLIGTMLGYA